MPESMNCPKCGVFNTMHAKCDKCDAKVCLACFVKNAESQKCSSCGAMFSVQPLSS
jgi:hypothetical protein